MVVLLDGNTSSDAHLLNNIVNVFYSRHLFTSTAVSNLTLFQMINALPSNIPCHEFKKVILGILK